VVLKHAERNDFYHAPHPQGGFSLSHPLIELQFCKPTEISVLLPLDLLTALSFIIKRTGSQEAQDKFEIKFLFKGI